jgi:alkylation response protein AidB-like acyl-CoA dehydrogenase
VEAAVFDFGLTEELELLVHTARSFAEKELTPRLRSAEAARAVEGGVRAAYVRIGLGGIELPIAFGGAGLGALARVLVNEELAAADAGTALALDGLGPALSVLHSLGGDSAIEPLIAPLLAQSEARALLVTPVDGTLEVGTDRISGRVAWVPADRVDLLVVLNDHGAIVVRAGVECERVQGSGLRAAGASALRLHEAPIVWRCDDPAKAKMALACARLYVASLLLGVLRQACDYSRRYAMERVAFGKPIAHHQALAFLITDMSSAVCGARLLVHEAACRAERGLAFEAAAASAFVETVEASRLVGPAGVQILGGHGFMQDHPVEKYMREARVLGLMLGGVDAAREDAGRALCEAKLPVALSASEAG